MGGEKPLGALAEEETAAKAVPVHRAPRGRRARGRLFLDGDRKAKQIGKVPGEFEDDHTFLLVRIGPGHN